MSKRIIAQNQRIVIGADVHDKKHNVTVMDSEGRELKYEAMSPNAAVWDKLLKRLPECEVTVVYEAGPHGYNLYDLIQALGQEAVVVAPESHVGPKTDRRDSAAVARDWLAGRAKVVTVPGFEKRVHRQVLRARDAFVKETNRLRNMLSGITRFHGIGGGLHAVNHDESGYLEFVIGQIKEVIEFISLKVKEMEAALSVIAREEDYRAQVEALREIKGVGLIGAMQVVLGVADMGAFESSGQFASYLGLCPGEFSSGERRRLGHISRRGPGRIRGTLVQCAWSAVRWDENQKEKFIALATRIGRKKAIVAIARRLAVRMWWALKELRDKPPEACADAVA